MNFNNMTSGSSGASTPVLNLNKGGTLDLTKAAPSLHRAILGGGWDVVQNGPDADLDLAAFMLDNQGHVSRIPDDVIFFNNMQAQGIALEGDNRTGAGDGDDERIDIDLDQIEGRISKIIFCITIFDAQTRRQSFGMVKNAYVRLLNRDDNEKEICRFNLTDNYGTDTALVACALNRGARGWEFEAIGDSYVADLNSLLQKYV